MISVFTVAGLLLLPSMVSAGGAPKISSNPTDIAAIADFPEAGCHDIKGHVLFESPQGGKVDIHVDVTKLPTDGGPFVYHIHENPVPENGDCEGVGKHFNPYHASPDCSAQDTHDYCQIGDLSGKYGCIDTNCFQSDYCDPYISLNHSSKASIIGRSVVFHYADLTKFACATIRYATEDQLKAIEEEKQQDKQQDNQEKKEQQDSHGEDEQQDQQDHEGEQDYPKKEEHKRDLEEDNFEDSPDDEDFLVADNGPLSNGKTTTKPALIETGTQKNHKKSPESTSKLLVNSSNHTNWSQVNQLGQSYYSDKGSRSSIGAILGTVASIVMGFTIW